MGGKMGNICKNKGSVTVEAAIALPVFICVIVSITFIIKVIYVHEIIQHAITETAGEISSVSYLYYVSGLQQTHDEVRDGLKSRGEVFGEHASVLFDSLENLKNPSEAGSLIDNAVEIPGTISEIAQNPVDEIKNIACFISAGVFEDIKTQLCIPLVKMYMKKHLEAGIAATADERLKRLNVVKGMEGIDLSLSSFFEDERNDIDIVARYVMDIPVPIKPVSEITIVQRATVKAWLGGDTGGLERTAGEEEMDIWLLSNFERGRRLRDIFGANLPLSFPVIARFDGGTAVMIKSMDLTAETYQDKVSVMDTIEGYIKALETYRGQEKPWGQSGIVIRNEDIRRKELTLIIPKNPIDPGIRAAIEECTGIAASRGINLRVEEYGIKGTADVPNQNNENLSQEQAD
jgi:hypothetical protein